MDRVFKYRGGDSNTIKRDLFSLYKNEFYSASMGSLNDPLEGIVVLDNESFTLRDLIAGGTVGNTLNSIHGNSLSLAKNALLEVMLLAQRHGIYSLSRNVLDEVMWSHYGNCHMGICIEYDLEVLMKEVKGNYMEVQYADCPPLISLESIFESASSSEKLMNRLIGTKSFRWKYEQELRVYTESIGVQKYDGEALKSIYFGVRCPDDLSKLIMKLFSNRKVEFYQLMVRGDSYVIEAIRISKS